MNVVAGKGKAAIPTETLIAPCIEIANVILDRLMRQIIPRTIFAVWGFRDWMCNAKCVGRPPFMYLLAIGSRYSSLNGRSLSESDEFMKLSHLLL